MVTLHPQKRLGPVKPLHGVNTGPIDFNWYHDYRDWFRRWRIPNVRTHDMAFDVFDTCDLHHLFPNPNADPNDPESYRFGLTDDVLQAIRDTGAEIYFRLGESIEHQPRMMWNRPERWTPQRMARVCANIVRHYNQGWSGGFEWGIRYWEFWNEPNGPKNWTGTPEQFFDLYRAAAAEIKKVDPVARVGLAGLSSGIMDHPLERTQKWRDGLEACARDGVPIDFVSWHRYINLLEEIPVSAINTRRYLDDIGLKSAESHLGEWGYRPFLQTERGGISVFATRDMKRYDLMTAAGLASRSSRATAMIFGTFARMQDLPLDLAQYYSANRFAHFGLFDEFGMPNRRAMAFEAFLEFLPSLRLEVSSDAADVAALAVTEQDGRKIRLGIANINEQNTRIPLKIESDASWSIRRMRVQDALYEWRETMTPTIGQPGEPIMLPISGAGLIVLELALEDPTANSSTVDGIGSTGAKKKPPAGDW